MTNYEKRRRELARREYDKLSKDDPTFNQRNNMSFDNWYVDFFLTTSLWVEMTEEELGPEEIHEEPSRFNYTGPDSTFEEVDAEDPSFDE